MSDNHYSYSRGGVDYYVGLDAITGDFVVIGQCMHPHDAGRLIRHKEHIAPWQIPQEYLDSAETSFFEGAGADPQRVSIAALKYGIERIEPRMTRTIIEAKGLDPFEMHYADPAIDAAIKAEKEAREKQEVLKRNSEQAELEKNPLFGIF